MVFDRLPRKLSFPVLGMVCIVGAIADSATAQVGRFEVQGSGSDPAGYRLFPPGSSTGEPDQLDVEVLDVVHAQGARCSRVSERPAAPSSPRKVQLEVSIRDLATEKRLRVQIHDLAALETPTYDLDALEKWLDSSLETVFSTPNGRVLLSKCLVPGSLKTVQSVVADALPRSFDQALAAQYGFSAERRHVDLVPGMRLCVDSTESVNWGNGKELVRAGPRTCFPVGHGRGDGLLLGFSPLLDRFHRLDIHTRKLQGARWTPGVLDLTHAALARPHYRIFFPKDPIELYSHVFPDEKLKVEQRPVLVGVSSEQDLELVSDCHADGDLSSLCEGATTCDDQPDRSVDPAFPPICRIFQEWGVPLPEISVRLKGDWIWVPLGTTLLDLLERHGNLGLAELIRDGAGASADARAVWVEQELDVKRHFHGRRVKVDFQPGFGSGAFWLPLFQGDEIQWND